MLPKAASSRSRMLVVKPRKCHFVREGKLAALVGLHSSPNSRPEVRSTLHFERQQLLFCPSDAARSSSLPVGLTRWGTERFVNAAHNSTISHCVSRP
ncbi:unnamed protein product [Protopolystoma xenopodis]|uniref:Uncharacterized protein n=1 Tax=Protopolystoma xenopodis TaxID=117903 RepID=A0A448WMU5_9PLAT|nr:unnamed protein product [Protopolystoma xenopodis]